MIISDCRSSKKKKKNVHAFYSCFNIIPVTILWKCHGDFFSMLKCFFFLFCYIKHQFKNSKTFLVIRWNTLMKHYRSPGLGSLTSAFISFTWQKVLVAYWQLRDCFENENQLTKKNLKCEKQESVFFWWGLCALNDSCFRLQMFTSTEKYLLVKFVGFQCNIFMGSFSLT